MINSKDYWDKIFKSDVQEERDNQTTFFAKLALENLPKWLMEDIEFNKMTICDAGCAEGGGTQVLSEEFKNNKVVGIDFSEEAIKIATAKFSTPVFQVADIKNLNQNYDVIFSSNVLEHFYNSTSILEDILKHVDKYCILLLPFREYYTVPEHFSYFDFQSFPLELQNHKLCYFKTMTMLGEQTNYWIGEQIVIVYANNNYIEDKNISLRNLYNGYIEERTQIIKNFDSKIEKIILEYNQYENENQQLAKEIEELESQKDKQLNELNLLKQRLIKIEEENKKIKEIKEKEYITSVEQLEEKYITNIKQLEKKLTSIAIENNKKEGIISYLEKNIVENKGELEQVKLEKDIIFAQKEQEVNKLYQLNDILNDLYIDREHIKYAINEIEVTQKAKGYKLALALRRTLNEFIKGNKEERKDFLRWTWSKCIKKDNGSKWLVEFDFLEEAKKKLNSTVHLDIFNKLGTQEIHPTSVNNCYKNTKQIFIFASVPYFDIGGGQRSAQLARIFNDMGYEVCYIYGFECSESKIHDMYIPTIIHKHIDDMSIEYMSKIIKKEAMFIFEIPFDKFEPYLDFAKRYKYITIYEHIDNWGTSLGCLFYIEDVFRRFLEKSDYLAVTARMLGEKLEELTDREYIYSANAVNSELFEPSKSYDCPADLKIGKAKTLLYFGSLWGEWFDWGKIEYIAQQCKDCTINLIGDYAPIEDRIKNMPKNVHFLGLKKQIELPAYLYYSDIALLPFKNCDIGKYVSPLKIFEYIAMNKVVLATPLDDIIGYPNTICSDSKEEWVEEIYKERDIENTTNFISNNNWYARCNELLNLANFEETKIPSISIVVLNYNNMKVITKCIDTLINHNKRYHYEIVVVDNKSKDGSYEYLKENYSDKIKLIRNSKNGCSSGRNLGVKNAEGDYICFLDSDQWVVSDRWLDSALDLLDNNKMLGAVSWNAGWFTPGKTTGPIVDYQPNRAINNPQMLYRTDIAYLATSGMIMRKDLFEEIKGFDEFYDPTCFEDTDISLKIRDAGFELAYCPYMAIMHLPHQTTQSGSDTHTQLMNRNGEYFKNKWEKQNESLLKVYLSN